MRRPPLNQDDLDFHRELWESHQITDYDFVLEQSCFCDPTYGLSHFSVGLLIVLVAIAYFVNSLSSLNVGAIVFGVLVFFCVFLFWAFPGWALLHHVISQFVEYASAK